MSVGVRLAPKTIAKALRLRGTGMTVSQVGEAMGISKCSVSGILHRHGGTTTRKPETSAAIVAGKARQVYAGGGGRRGGPVAVDDMALVGQVRALWDAGRSLRQIGDALEVGKDVVDRMRKRYGWPPRAAPEPAARPMRVEAAPTAPAWVPPPVPPEERRCQYPIGEPRSRGFRFCGAPVTRADTSYCTACRRICYTRVAA